MGAQYMSKEQNQENHDSNSATMIARVRGNKESPEAQTPKRKPWLYCKPLLKRNLTNDMGSDARRILDSESSPGHSCRII
jgi:hypothetical protein